MRKPWMIWLVLTMSLTGAGLWAAEVYTWTDARGLTHITDRPPPPGVQVTAVAKDKRPIVEKISSETAAAAATDKAREQLQENQSAWQTVQDLAKKVSAAQAAYEDAVAAVQEAQAKFAYSAKRRKAPRQAVTDLEEKAQAAFAEYRQLLDAYNAAQLAAREAEQRAQGAIDAVNPEIPPTPLPDAPVPERTVQK